MAARAVLAGHGTFADGMRDAVARIAGRAEAFVPFSNTGLGAAELEVALGALLAADGPRVVFTDLPAGSCTIAARRLAARDAGLTVVTGANLPMLLAFALSAEPDPRVAAHAAVDKGRAAVAVHP